MKKSERTPFAERLAEERRRLGLTQNAFAKAVKVSARSALDWELGVASPKADYLTEFARLGVDVVYILTGERSKPVEDTFSPRLKALLDNYKHTDPEGQKIIEQMAFFAAQQAKQGNAVSRASFERHRQQVGNKSKHSSPSWRQVAAA